MIKEISKKELAKFSIYPEMDISVGHMSDDVSMENIEGFIDIMTNVTFERENILYAVLLNKKHVNKGYLTIQNIRVLLDDFEREVKQIKEKSKIEKESEYVTFWKIKDE